jgi:hypothetical protein
MRACLVGLTQYLVGVGAGSIVEPVLFQYGVYGGASLGRTTSTFKAASGAPCGTTS